MKNQRYNKADHIELAFPYARLSGEPVRVGGYCGVSLKDTGNGERGTVWLDGSYDVSVTGAVASEGLPIYITAAGALTTTSTGNFVWGLSLGTKGSGAGLLEVAPVGKSTQTAASA